MKLLSTFSALFFTVATFGQTDMMKPEGLKIGDKAPDFTAVDQSGKKIMLSNLLVKENVVLVFYRGQWCPYCNKYLSKLNDSLLAISTKGATVITVTPETEENVSKTIKKTKATFSIISDKDLTIMKSYKVSFAVDEKTIEKYKGYGIDFEKANGKNGANLPVPATYIIGKDGVIKYAFFNVDYSKRATVKDILENL